MGEETNAVSASFWTFGVISVDFFSTFSLGKTGLGSGTLFDLAILSFEVSAAVGAVATGTAAAVGDAIVVVLFTVGDVVEPSETGTSKIC